MAMRLPKRLAFDLRIGDLGVAGEAAEEMALARVEIGSDLVAAVEDERIAATRIADRHDENRPLEVVRKLGREGGSGVDRIGGVGLSVEPRGEQGMVAGQRIGVVGVPSGAEASGEQAVLLAKQSRRRQAQRAHRLVHQQAARSRRGCRHSEWSRPPRRDGARRG